MKNIDRRIKKGTFVLIEGFDQWHKVKDVADHKKYLSVENIAGSFQMGQIIKFTNNRLNTLSLYEKKIKRIAEKLTNMTDLWPDSDSVFGACHTNNTSFTRLNSDAGAVVLVEENSTNWVIENHHVFVSYEDYAEWFNNQLNDYGRGMQKHYGDCSLAYRAARNLGWVEDNEY